MRYGRAAFTARFVVVWILAALSHPVMVIAQQDVTVAADAMTCKVKSVDVETRELRAITGVGHALRVMVFHADPACQIRIDEDQAGLQDLKPGAIVVVRYRKTPECYEAASIEVLQTPRVDDQ